MNHIRLITTACLLASLAAPLSIAARAQVAPGVGVGAGGASAGLGGATQTGPTNITGAGAGVSTINPQIGNPATMTAPGAATATPGLVTNPAPIAGPSGVPGVPFTPPHAASHHGAAPR